MVGRGCWLGFARANLPLNPSAFCPEPGKNVQSGRALKHEPLSSNSLFATIVTEPLRPDSGIFVSE